MQYNDLNDFLKTGSAALTKGPVALILVEDLIEVETCIRHHLQLGFKQVLVFGPPEISLPERIAKVVHLIPYDMTADAALQTAVNSIINVAPGQWLYYCYNAEYLFFPFCESRTVGEMLAFSAEERRNSILTYVIDLYAADLEQFPNAVCLEDAHLDKSGYYALARPDPANHNHPKTRQLDFFGGLRWRFEEHIPAAKRKIDRIALFRAKPGLKLREDHCFNDEEYNTYSCEWHHNITAAICSFRTAKALKHNPGSTFDIDNFRWHNSCKFEWHSQQLLDLGLMEPGQWF
ncbi:MAG: hypothetical protein CSA68_07035 [Rhodobacterales bacterium]|nr:MAG: hypothetical protein CSA68_07035 [Rhodobacterales bacterium]